MDYMVACPDRELLVALCAFADHLARPDPRDPRGVRHATPVLLATRLVALAGGANGMAAVAAFTHDHRAWFRWWLPLGAAPPPRAPYLRLVRRLDPETALQAALWLRDGTRLPDLRDLIRALDGQGRAPFRRPGRRHAGPAHGQCLPGTGRADLGPGAMCGQEQREHGHAPPARPPGPEGDRVTIDAAGCQTAIVQALRPAGATKPPCTGK